MIDLMPNTTLAVQWVIFMVAVATLHFGVFKPTLKIVQGRRSRSIGAKHEAEVYRKKTEEKTAFLERSLEEARRSGYQKRETALQQGEKQVEEILRKARTEVNHSLEVLRKEIERETKEAAIQLRQYAQELSRDVAAKVLERAV